jgi:hypothetical protein
LPLLEADILPSYSADDLQVVAIHCYPDAMPAVAHVQRFGLSFPMAFDFDSELFRRFRIPDHVYPLNIVIDQQGKFAHVGTTLEDALTAVDSLLP